MLVLLCSYNFFHCSCEGYMFTWPNVDIVVLSAILSNAMISKRDLVKDLTLKCKTTFIRYNFKVIISFKVCSKIEINKFFENIVLMIYKDHSTVGKRNIIRISVFLGTPNKIFHQQTKFKLKNKTKRTH